MQSDQILPRFEVYYKAVAKLLSENSLMVGGIAAILTLAEAVSTVRVSVNKQSWTELADVLRKL